MAGEKGGTRERILVGPVDEFYGQGAVHPDELAHALLEAASVLRFVGGSMSIGAVRQEIQTPGGPEMATTKVLMVWQKWGQTVRPEPTPEPTPDEEPVLDGVQTD